MEILKITGKYVIICLLTSFCFGYTFLKSYQQFQIGVKEQKDWKIWGAFTSVSFAILLFFMFFTRVLI